MRISKAAFDLILKEEVSSKTRYEKLFRSTVWPGESSGVTFGIGYDAGYVTRDQLRAEWSDRIPDAMIEALLPCVGVKGPAAKPLAARVKGKIDIPFDVALKQFKDVKLPKFEAKTAKAFPGSANLPADCFGALVSLVFNRGELVSKSDKRIEMFNIREHIRSGDLDQVPDEFRAMKRHWPKTKGLRDRREREATLFERGLRSLVKPAVAQAAGAADYQDEPEAVAPAGEPMTAAVAQSQDTITHVQEQLKKLGYHDVGEADGGRNGMTKTEAAILAFRNDNGLPTTPAIDADLILALSTAKPRPIADARANATAKDIAPKVEAVKATWWSKAWAWVLGIPSAISAAASGAMDYFDTAREKLEPVKDFLGDVPLWVWGGGLVVVAVAIWKMNNKAEAETVKAYREGRLQ